MQQALAEAVASGSDEADVTEEPWWRQHESLNAQHVFVLHRVAAEPVPTALALGAHTHDASPARSVGAAPTELDEDEEDAAAASGVVNFNDWFYGTASSHATSPLPSKQQQQSPYDLHDDKAPSDSGLDVEWLPSELPLLQAFRNCRINFGRRSVILARIGVGVGAGGAVDRRPAS